MSDPEQVKADDARISSQVKKMKEEIITPLFQLSQPGEGGGSPKGKGKSCFPGGCCCSWFPALCRLGREEGAAQSPDVGQGPGGISASSCQGCKPDEFLNTATSLVAQPRAVSVAPGWQQRWCSGQRGRGCVYSCFGDTESECIYSCPGYLITAHRCDGSSKHLPLHWPNNPCLPHEPLCFGSRRCYHGKTFNSYNSVDVPPLTWPSV